MERQIQRNTDNHRQSWTNTDKYRTVEKTNTGPAYGESGPDGGGATEVSGGQCLTRQHTGSIQSKPTEYRSIFRKQKFIFFKEEK